METPRSPLWLLLYFSVAPLVSACGSEGDPLVDPASSEDEVTSSLALTCEWSDLPGIFSEALANTSYALTIQDSVRAGAEPKPSKATGVITNDPRPDNWKYERMEGDARLYVGKETAIPVTVTMGRWSLVQVLTVPKAVASGRAGEIKINHYVLKGTSITPLKGSEEEELVERMENVPDNVERAQRAITTELVTQELKAKCKKGR
jgi:hypothetical protein